MVGFTRIGVTMVTVVRITMVGVAVVGFTREGEGHEGWGLNGRLPMTMVALGNTRVSHENIFSHVTIVMVICCDTCVFVRDCMHGV